MRRTGRRRASYRGESWHGHSRRHLVLGTVLLPLITCLHSSAQLPTTPKSRYLVPKASPEFRKRAGLALALLVGSKILNVQVPFFFKYTG